MAKTRMLKHNLRTSVKVASWPIEVRYFWVLLWGYVDDHGKGIDNSLLIKADCFPLDPDVTGEVIDGWLWHLADAGVVARYTVGVVDYLQVVNWREHQKPPHPTDDVLPGQDDNRAIRRGLHASRMNNAGNPPAPLTPGLGWDEFGVGSGFGIESSPPATDLNPPPPNLEALFKAAYAGWPKKKELAESRKKFAIAAKQFAGREQELVDLIIKFGRAYAATTEKQMIPALAWWLNRERWTDELPANQSQPATAAQRNLSTVEHFARLEANDEQAGVVETFDHRILG